MQRGFVLRANIARYEQLLATGGLSVDQVATISAMLDEERAALALETGWPRPARGTPPKAR